MLRSSINFFLLLVLTGNCQSMLLAIEVVSVPWPEADVLFHRDSRWRGSDAANTVDLGEGRILWTFGDSFVTTEPDVAKRRRVGSTMINNSVAIQSGYDPTNADFVSFSDQTSAGKPLSFFHSEEETYYWPTGGALIREKLLIFLMRIQNAEGGLGFRSVGWGAVLINNPEESPAQWQKEYVNHNHLAGRILVGSGGLLIQDNWLYAYSAGADPEDRQLYLARFQIEDALALRFSRPAWWHPAARTWIASAELQGGTPPPMHSPAAPESTIHFEPQLQKYVLFQMETFPVGPLVMWTATEFSGPWGKRRELLEPEEIQTLDKDLMIYSVKAHPEQTADGLAVTYCSNSRDLKKLLQDERLYYPRFVRVEFHP